MRRPRALPPVPDIRRDFKRWKPISSQEALRICVRSPVAAVISFHGRMHAMWVEPLNPLSRSASSGHLTYYLYQGEEAKERYWPSAPSAPREPEELEPLAYLDLSGALVSIAAEGPKRATKTEKEKFPIEFQLLTASGDAYPPVGYKLTMPDGTVMEGKSDAEGFIRYLDNEIPGEVFLELVDPNAPPPDAGEIVSLAWEKQTLQAWDASNAAEMKTRLKVETKDLPACDAVLEIFQFAADGSHAPYKKIEGLKLDGASLTGPDGRDLEIKIEWHDSIYAYGKTQYFCKLTAQGKEKDSGQDKASLLQLKHFDGVIANPSGDLPGAGREGTWVDDYFKKSGPWLEATGGELVADGHASKMIGATTTAGMKALVEANKFVHHQSSHGTAYCTCNGTKNYFVNSNTKGADGVNDYWCPVCKKIDTGVGCIFLKDWSNLFFIDDVKGLARWPKDLILANCCLTAITPAYGEAWNAKGTRWYIGWAVPVGDTEAVDFAKAFYKKWMVAYKMNPDDVKKAFNDVKGPYAKFRPRIFGK